MSIFHTTYMSWPLFYFLSLIIHPFLVPYHFLYVLPFTHRPLLSFSLHPVIRMVLPSSLIFLPCSYSLTLIPFFHIYFLSSHLDILNPPLIHSHLIHISFLYHSFSFFLIHIFSMLSFFYMFSLTYPYPFLSHCNYIPSFICNLTFFLIFFLSSHIHILTPSFIYFFFHLHTHFPSFTRLYPLIYIFLVSLLHLLRHTSLLLSLVSYLSFYSHILTSSFIFLLPSHSHIPTLFSHVLSVLSFT